MDMYRLQVINCRLKITHHRFVAIALPTLLKHAHITPVFKSGDRALTSNYRPVALTSIVSKIMETIIANTIRSHLADNCLLSPVQHGFTKGKSCVRQLLSITNDWLTILDTRKPPVIDAILLDFSKAFDVMPHDILLNKLSSLHNITEDVWRWLRSFISGRQQRVQYQEHYSDWSTTTSGIPQGSVLGPLLFNIFINELPACFNSSCALFADDTVIYRPLFSPSDHVTLQNDLDIMAQWCMDNKMKLNPTKTKVMRFTCSKNPACPVYNLYSVALQVVDEIKYLGIILNNRLTWDSHVRYVTLRSNIMLGLISSMATGLSTNALVVSTSLWFYQYWNMVCLYGICIPKNWQMTWRGYKGEHHVLS